MKPFATLLDRLLHSPQRNAKLRLLADYFQSTPDPDRGYALAALTGALDFVHTKPALIRELAMRRSDPVLFELSYDFVGDLAETTALIWPPATVGGTVRLRDVVERLQSTAKTRQARLIEGWLDQLEPDGRWALLKLITGGLRVGVSARLTRLALAELSHAGVEEIEELWHGLEPPYGELFAWLEGRAAKPALGRKPVFRPLMLASPLEDEDKPKVDLAAYALEWKWDGIRVQIAASPGETRLYSRSGDDISGSFPEIIEAAGFHGVLDGELLVVRDGRVGSFNDLQQRLGRKAPTAALLQSHPAFVHLYDVLFDGERDLRPLPFIDRRRQLVAFFERECPPLMDVSPLLEARGWDELEALRQSCEQSEREGLMLKRKDSPYVAGRPKGPWLKYKRDALTLDCVLMYAQRGHGKRSSFYSDFTFGVWRSIDGQGEELVPVGKAYFGFTDAELAELDRYVRAHTTSRFGPVREVEHALVLEIAFDSVARSSRHKSGVAMRFPRVHRIRWDKPAHEADRLDTLLKMLS
jgi:DNA ligase-1